MSGKKNKQMRKVAKQQTEGQEIPRVKHFHHPHVNETAILGNCLKKREKLIKRTYKKLKQQGKI